MATLKKDRVVVAMSGGVDSSVAAHLLKNQGLEVIGISMKTHEGPSLVARDSSHASKTCCSVSDIGDARSVCHKLDIPFYAMNFKEEFKSDVMDYFAEEYAAGRTPNPCVKCNDQLKFKALLREARALGAYYLATGHYVRKDKDEWGRWRLHRAKDLSKDQSYFLFGLGQEQLEYLLFPLGDLSKLEVRQLAHSAGLVTAEKPESQEICFVPNNDYAQLIEEKYPHLKKNAGEFRDRLGRFLGRHRGAHAYTVGQRRGLGLAAKERLYVTAIDSEKNEVQVGKEHELYSSSLTAQNVRWICGLPNATEIDAQVKIRYRHEPASAQITVQHNNQVVIHFTKPQRAITPGQAIVFYRGDEMIGGGWIDKALV